VQQVTFVCLTSRLCNLRCSYCDELPLLADKRRMSLDQLEAMFRHVAEYYPSAAPVSIVFQWYGGEPLLIPPEYYREAFTRQHGVFGSLPHSITNTVQTNLTINLTPDVIRLLETQFDRVGVSLDLFGGLRVDAGGHDRETDAISNLDRLIELGFGPKLSGITVLSGGNRTKMKSIFEFYRARRMSFRILPLEQGLYGSSAGFAISAREVLRALCEMADLWMQDPCVEIEPLGRCFRMITYAAANADNRVSLYDRARWESVQMIDVDGELYGYPDRFKPDRSIGNIFQTPLSGVWGSDRHSASVSRAFRRMDRTCLTCPYLGRSCDGGPIADGEMSYGEYRADGSEFCVITRGLLRHFEIRLQQAGLLAPGAIRRDAWAEVE
jgi:uncharacterized protein